MKKQRILLTLCLCSLLLSGCGEEPAPTVTTAPETTVPTVTETTAATTAATTEETVLETTEETLPFLYDFDRTPQIEETLLYDGADLKITALEIAYEPEQAVLVLRAENPGTEALSMETQLKRPSLTAVNGRFVPADQTLPEVKPGETEEFRLAFSYEDLLDRGIHAMGDLRFSLAGDQFATGYMDLSTGEAYEPFLDWVKGKKDGISLNFLEERIAYDEIGVRHMATVIYQTPEGKELLCLDFKNTTERTLILSHSEHILNGLHLLRESEMLTLLPKGRTQLIFDLGQIREENRLDNLNMEKPGNMDFIVSLYRETMSPAMDKRHVKLTFDPDVPAFSGGGTPLVEESDLVVTYGGPCRTEMDGDETLGFVLCFQNRSSDMLTCQTAGLTYNGEDLPCDRMSLRLTENGYGIFLVRVDPGYGDKIDLNGGKLTLTLQQRISGKGGIVSYDLPLGEEN